MPEKKIHNLNEGIEESFNFLVLGYEYNFRQMTTEELDAFATLTDKSNKEVREYLYQFVSPVGEKTPPFSETAKKMLTPHWVAFLNMVKSEMGV